MRFWLVAFSWKLKKGKFVIPLLITLIMLLMAPAPLLAAAGSAGNPPFAIIPTLEQAKTNMFSAYQTPFSETPELDSELISLTVKGAPYTAASPAVVVETDEVFMLSALMKNTGTATWGQFLNDGERGASLLARAPDYNDTFGVFFISPGQGQRTQPQETFEYVASLRAPATAGEYTMTWQLADWIILYQDNPDTFYYKRPFYGATITVNISVAPRAQQPPQPQPRVPGVLDIFDLEYEGSFTLPNVPNVPQDEKTYFNSGITLRTVAGERRLLLTTGTYEQSLYEIAIPPPGKFVGYDDSAVPEAELRTVFGALPKHSGPDYIDNSENGTMWFDEQSGLLYWTNFHGYYGLDSVHFPLLRSARLESGQLTEVQQWLLPANTPYYKAYWSGVTSIPAGFAEKYTEGRQLALGFGGAISLIQSCSMGPSLAAVTADLQAGELDFQNIIYYPFPETCIRDGNYFFSYTATDNPLNPWQGTWTNKDIVGSGVFIDLPDKQGYIAFAKQSTGRVGYDYGGSNWNGQYQSAWYFYDFATLGKAAQGLIPHNGITPASLSVVALPYDQTKDKQYIASSCFDPQTRRLYLYTLLAVTRGGLSSQPVVHVYRVREDTLTVNGQVQYQTSSRQATVKLYGGNGTLLQTVTTAPDGTYTLTAAAGPGYTLVATKPSYLSYTVKNLTLTEGENLPTIDIRQMAGDIDGDGVVNATDQTYLLSEFNRNPVNSAYPYADIDGNGIVNATDLTYLLAGFNKHNLEIIM